MTAARLARLARRFVTDALDTFGGYLLVVAVVALASVELAELTRPLGVALLHLAGRP